jgi:hypothetical protein
LCKRRITWTRLPPDAQGSEARMSDPFVDAANRIVNARQPGQCKACWALENLETAERRNALRDLLSSKIGNKKLANLCSQNNIDLGETTISNHRAAGHSA